MLKYCARTLKILRKSALSGEISYFRLDKSDSAGNFTGTQAASACIYVARFAINKSFYATNVSFPGSVGTSVGVGNFDTKANTFSAEITFGHSGTSFVLSESQRSYYIKL